MTSAVRTRQLPTTFQLAMERSLKKREEGSSKRETEEQASIRIEARYLTRATTPLRAIRAKCVQCQAGRVKEIARCKEESCALHPFRMEKNTFHSKVKK